MKYPLATSSWDEAEILAINKVIESDRYSMGVEVSNYEIKFSNYVGAKHTVMVSSGSAANLLMIAALFFTSDERKRLKRGDEIIVPAVSWSTTYFPLQQYGLKVKFVDIDRQTLNIDLKKLEDAITERTKAILAVNLLGNPNDFHKIEGMISGSDIILLEDNCESLGAVFAEKQAGTFGLMGTFSSFFSHHISTMEGGCIVTDDEELYHILLTLRAHGWTRDLPKDNRVTGTKNEDNFEESYKFVLPGYNVRPLEMSGAIGVEQIKKLPNFITQRRKNAEYFKSLFDAIPSVATQKEIGSSSWFGFALILTEECCINRNELIAVFNQHEIECRPIVSGNFLKNKTVLKHFNYKISGKIDEAKYIENNGLFVGNQHENLQKEIEYLADVVTSVVNK